MPKIIGIDLGTTFSKIAVWNDTRRAPVVIPNQFGNWLTPSVVGFDQAGQVLIGEAVDKNHINFEDSVASIARQMGTDFHVIQHGQLYKPQVISAFILRYLKQCAEAYLGEPVFDAFITCPVYYTEVQRKALREAGAIAGLNVHQIINSSTAAAIALKLVKSAQVQDKIFVVCDLGGGTFNLCVAEFDYGIVIQGSGGDPRLGGLDMDEAVMTWALRQIRQQYGADLSSNEAVRHRLKLAAVDLKKALVVSETASLNVPYLAMVDGHVLSPDLKITRAQFEALIAPLLERMKRCIEETMASVYETNAVDWKDIDGCLLVGGCSRLPAFRRLLREVFAQHCPGKQIEFHSDVNPDEAAVMGAAILGTQFAPIGIPPDRDEHEKLEAQGHNLTFNETYPDIGLYNATSHTLGIAIEGVKFHRLIHKYSPLPVSVTRQGFTNAGNAIEIRLELFQGENDFVAANTKIGEVKIEGLKPLPRGELSLEVEFIIDLNGIIETVCTDTRTGEDYPCSIIYTNSTMSQEEVRKWQVELQARKPDAVHESIRPHVSVKPISEVKAKPKPVPVEPLVAPQLPLESIPAEWRDYWAKCQSLLPQLDRAKAEILTTAMINFADAVKKANPARIEANGLLLQDALLEVWM